MNIIKESKKHLDENNMSYCSHFLFASKYGIHCIISGLFLILHAIIPAMFSKTGSNITNKLNKAFTDNNEWLQLKEQMEQFRNIYYSNDKKQQT
jgi:hypothetical protein